MKKEVLLLNICRKISNYSEEELEKFFQAFFTKKEILTLEGRVHLIDLLLKKVPQREIAKTLGVSFTQITRGSHELKEGVGKEFFPRFFEK